MKITLIFLFFCLISIPVLAGDSPEEDPPEIDYVKVIHPIVEKHCFSCHYDQKRSGGVNIKNFFVGINDFENRIIKGGKLWMNIIKQVESGQMPPNGEPPMSVEEQETLVKGVNAILTKSLNANNPGRVVIRRLSIVSINILFLIWWE